MARPRTAACFACRHRKSQCKVEAEHSRVCMMCRSHETECVFPPPRVTKQRRTKRKLSEVPGDERDSTSRARRPSQDFVVLKSVPESVAEHDHISDQQRGPRIESPLVLEAGQDSASGQRLIGPVLASDSQHVSRLLETRGVEEKRDVRAVVLRHSSELSTPIVFTQSRRRPMGVRTSVEPARDKLEIVQKLVEPWKEELLKLYMSKVETCCHLLSKKQLEDVFDDTQAHTSPALMACLLAHALTFWNSSPTLKSHRRPDQRFIWNLANEALFLEMRLSPRLSTIAAVLLNISGRPTSMVFNNTGQLGFAVSLAYTLGLHRDPRDWEINSHEKKARVNVWRGLVLYDRWQSLAYGSPPLISATHFDVPLVESSSSPHAFDTDIQSIQFHLLSLTEHVLMPQLSEMYRLDASEKGGLSSSSPRKDNTRLQQWTDSSTDVSRTVIIRGRDLSVPGAANLRLAFLAVQFLDCRTKSKPDGNANEEMAKDSRAMRAAEDVVYFLQELNVDHLRGFWMPTMGFVLLMVMTFLIRSVLDSEEGHDGEGQPLILARTMMECLRQHRDQHDWDIAHMCIEYYDEALQKLTDVDHSGNLLDLDFDVELLNTPFIWDEWAVNG